MMVEPIIMRDGILDRFDTGEIGGVERVLPPWPGLRLLAQNAGKCIGYRIQRGNGGQSQGTAPFLQLLPHCQIDEGEKHQARIGGDIDKDAFEMRFGPNHRPEMLDHINLVELRECRLGNILQRFTGGVR